MERPANKTQGAYASPRYALKRLIAYVKDNLQEPLEREYNAVCDTLHAKPMGPADVVDEARASTDPEWLKVLPYLQDMILCAKETKGRRVGFYGERGAGKSSLINAILGGNLLPVSASSTCTAAVSEIMPWDLPHYSASIYFVSPGEWDLEMKMARELSAVTSPDEEREERLESALEKIRALCGGVALPDWKLPPELEKLLKKGSEHLVSNNPKELAAKLRPYIDAGKNLWPLVDRVYIRGPFDALHELDISLLDIPGVKDGYSSMSRRTEEAIGKCDAVFFMPPLAKAVTKDTINQLASLALTPHVGIVVTHLADYLEDDEEGIKTVENAGSLLRDALTHLAKCQSLAMSVDTPVYCVEAKVSSAEHAAALASFIEQELRQPSDTDVRNHAQHLQNEFNCSLRLLREAMLGRNENKAGAKKILDTARAALARELETTNASPQVRRELDGLFVQPTAEAVLKIFASRAYNTIQMRIREGNYGLTLDMPKVRALAWDDLDPAFASPSLKQVLGNFREHVKVTDDQLETWQRRLEDVRTRVLQDAKYTLLWRLACATRQVEAALNLWKAVRDRSGRGLKQFYLSTLKAELPAVLLAQRKGAEEALVSWRSDTLASLRHETLSVFAQLQAVLAPLCNVTTISPEKRAFFEELLAPINVLNQRPDVEELSPIAKHTGEPHSLTDIHTLHPCLTAIPTAVAKLYSNTTIARPGFVYVMTNTSFRHDLFKIGLTTRPLENRAKQLYTTGVPQPFDIKHHWATDNCRVFESLMHKLFAAVRENKKREFFQAELDLIIKVGDVLHGILQART